MARIALLLFLTLVGLLPPPASASAKPPPLQEIIDKTLAFSDFQQQELQTMQYDQVAQIDQLDSKDKITRHEVLHMVVTPGANPSIKIVSVEGDHLASDPDQAKAQQQGRDVESNKQNFTLRALVNRFTVGFVGMDQIGGVPTYVISFTPKANQPAKDETEKVVNQLQGRMWISTRTYDVLRTEASLQHPISIAWFLAKIPTLDFHYATTDMETGFAPSQVKITLEIDAFFVGYHQRQTVDMTNFIQRAPLAAK